MSSVNWARNVVTANGGRYREPVQPIIPKFKKTAYDISIQELDELLIRNRRTLSSYDGVWYVGGKKLSTHQKEELMAMGYRCETVGSLRKSQSMKKKSVGELIDIIAEGSRFTLNKRSGIYRVGRFIITRKQAQLLTDRNYRYERTTL